MSLFIPDGVERICRDAFASCTGLKNVSLPQSLTVLERCVFYNCAALEEIAIPAGVLPAKAVEAYKKDFYWREYNIEPME